jgi:hypothetical protein
MTPLPASRERGHRAVYHKENTMPCENCGGRRWVISERDDGRRAVERCDNCSFYGWDDTRSISDAYAAKLATAAGVLCEPNYPCYIVEPQRRS